MCGDYIHLNCFWSFQLKFTPCSIYVALFPKFTTIQVHSLTVDVSLCVLILYLCVYIGIIRKHIGNMYNEQRIGKAGIESNCIIIYMTSSFAFLSMLT